MAAITDPCCHGRMASPISLVAAFVIVYLLNYTPHSLGLQFFAVTEAFLSFCGDVPASAALLIYSQFVRQDRRHSKAAFLFSLASRVSEPVYAMPLPNFLKPRRDLVAVFLDILFCIIDCGLRCSIQGVPLIKEVSRSVRGKSVRHHFSKHCRVDLIGRLINHFFVDQRCLVIPKEVRREGSMPSARSRSSIAALI
jgi:hypothetical protein